MLDRDEKKNEEGRREKEMREILSIQPLLHKSLTTKQAKKNDEGKQ